MKPIAMKPIAMKPNAMKPNAMKRDCLLLAFCLSFISLVLLVSNASAQPSAPTMTIQVNRGSKMIAGQPLIVFGNGVKKLTRDMVAFDAEINRQ